MGLLANAVVDVGANLRPLSSGLAQAKTMLRGFTGSDFKIPLAISLGAGGASIGGITAVLGDAAVKAAKLAESVNKIKIVFGPEAGGILKSTDELADKFGIVKTTAASAAAQFGLLAKSAGMSAEDQASFAKEFTQLAVDLASFHFTTHEEAVRKLLSGLEGMPRPLRDFGVFLNESKVKAEAAAMGLAHHGEELSEEAKILARVAIIRREASAASGDAERSLGRNYEQMKKFWGDLENATTEFGKDLQGALSAGIQAARELGKLFRSEFGPNIGTKIGEGLKTTAENWGAVFKTIRILREPPKENKLEDFGKIWKFYDSVRDAAFEMDKAPGGGKGMPATLPDIQARIREQQVSGTLADIEAARQRAFQPFLEKIWRGMETVGAFRGKPTEAIPAVAKLLDFLRTATAGPVGALRGEGVGGRALRAGLGFIAPPSAPLTEEEQMRKDIIEEHNKDVRRRKVMRELGLEAPKASEIFTDPEEYGRAMVQGALEPTDQTDKEILEAVKESNTSLTEDGRQIIQTLRTFGQSLGLIPR